MIDSELGAKLTYILGITNLIGLGLVLVSCRCLMGAKLASKLSKIPGYRKILRHHCQWWWLFFISVGIHSILAILAFGNPF